MTGQTCCFCLQSLQFFRSRVNSACCFCGRSLLSRSVSLRTGICLLSFCGNPGGLLGSRVRGLICRLGSRSVSSRSLLCAFEDLQFSFSGVQRFFSLGFLVVSGFKSGVHILQVLVSLIFRGLRITQLILSGLIVC